MRTTLPTALPEGDKAIVTRELQKRFGSTKALLGVDLSVPEGAFYVLVGPNGAGKSTLLRILMDLVRADGGSAGVLRLDSRNQGPAVRAHIGYVPELHRWENGWMRVSDLLRHHSAYFPTWDVEYAARLVARLRIESRARYGRLSKGQARRVQLVLALAHRPPVLLLDEPTDGLDPVAREETLSILADHLAERPASVLVSTHLVHEIERLADHLGVIAGGRLHAQLPTSSLQARLRRYRAGIPEGWVAPSELEGSVLRRRDQGREILWTVWGEDDEVIERLAASGATVREVSRLTLEEAVVTILGTEEVNDDG